MMNTLSFHKVFLPALLAVITLGLAPKIGAQGQRINKKTVIEAQTSYIEGLAAFENKNYEKAVTLLKRAYVRLPGHPGINYALADAYLKVNELNNAEYYSKQAISLDPENRWFHLQLVTIYKSNGQYEAAVNTLKNALLFHYNDVDLLYELAQTYSEMGQLREANNVYNKLLQLEGERISIHLEKFKNFDELNKRDSSIVELEKTRKLEPNNLSTIYLLSDYYLKLKQPGKARKVLDDTPALNQKDPQTLILLSKIYIQQEQWDSLTTTISSFMSDSTIAVNNKLAIARFIYSKFNENRKHKQLRHIADTVFSKLIEETPKSGNVYTLAAHFFVNTEQPQQALKALEQTTNLNPANDTAWQHRLQLLLSEGRISETIEVGQQAAKHIPQDPVILYFLGSAYLTDKQYSNAIDHLEEASKLPARKALKANIYGSLGDTYAVLKKWTRVFNYYQKAVDLGTQNPGIYGNYAYYLSQNQKNLPKAQELARQAVNMSPDNASYLDTLGWIYYQQGAWEKAKKYVEKAIQTGTADAETLEHMGDIMNKLDRTEEAKQWWKKALHNDSTRTHLKDKISP